jgi:hypothetical protein
MFCETVPVYKCLWSKHGGDRPRVSSAGPTVGRPGRGRTAVETGRPRTRSLSAAHSAVLHPQHACSLVALAVLLPISCPSTGHAQVLARQRPIVVSAGGLASADLELRAPDGQVSARARCDGLPDGESDSSGEDQRCRLSSDWWRGAGTYTFAVDNGQATHEVALELDGNELELAVNVAIDDVRVYVAVTRAHPGLRLHVVDGAERRVYLVNETSVDLPLVEWDEGTNGSTPWSFTEREGERERVVTSGYGFVMCGNAIQWNRLPAYAIRSRHLQRLVPDSIEPAVREGRYTARIDFGRIDVTPEVSDFWVVTFEVDIRVGTSGELMAIVLPSPE